MECCPQGVTLYWMKLISPRLDSWWIKEIWVWVVQKFPIQVLSNKCLSPTLNVSSQIWYLCSSSSLQLSHFCMCPGPQPLSPPAHGLFTENGYKEADPAESGEEIQGAGKQQRQTSLVVCLSHCVLLSMMRKDWLFNKLVIFLLFFLFPGNISHTAEP